MKKIASKGAGEAFLRAHVDFDGNECLIWPYATNKLGYGFAVIGGLQLRSSRWMCILAHGDPPSGKPFAAHSCGNPSCVNPLHLRWASPKENSEDRDIHGTKIYGERSGKTHLTEEDVRAIRNAPPNLMALADIYGVSKGCISKIRSRQRWPHV